METDFLDAHERHWIDAEQLFATQRWANADHLYGIATECGLKQLMIAFGMPYDAARDQPAQHQDRAHADSIWARFESYRHGHLHGAAYLLPANNPFHNWKVSDRYAHQSNFDQARANAHQAGTRAVCELIRKARREGILT